MKTAILELLDILPSAEMLQQMDKFAWFMIWTGFTSDRYNTLDDLKAVFTLPKVINYRDRVPHNR